MRACRGSAADVTMLLERGIARDETYLVVWREVKAYVDTCHPAVQGRLLAFAEGFLEGTAYWDGLQPSYMPGPPRTEIDWEGNKPCKGINSRNNEA